jgi:O-methyltransferase involved in polyketide biosynthesis
MLMKTVSDTAFFVNESRSRKVELSRDIYAHLWITDEIRHMWDDFSREVYPHDDIALAIRNRFFLEQMIAFQKMSPDAVFINLGAGFTSYPFLFLMGSDFIEVDFEHVLEFKKKKILEWLNSGILPLRNITYFAADLNDCNHRAKLKENLGRWIMRRPSFILMEGLTYYLDSPILEELLASFMDAQNPGSVVAFDFWNESNEQSPVFIRFKKYWDDKFGVKKYKYIENESLRSIDGYEISILTDVVEQERIFSDNPKMLSNEDVLPENYVVLRRVGR